jgi:predicted acyltransferase
VLVSGGWCFLLLAAFHAVIDVLGFSNWSFPLRVIGANSIVAYCMAHPLEAFVTGSFHTHFGKRPFQLLGEVYEPLLSGAAVLLTYWLVLFWMYRKQIFVRV